MAHNGCGTLDFVIVRLWLVFEVGQIADALPELGGCRRVFSDEFVESVRKHQHGALVVLSYLGEVSEAPSGDQLTRKAGQGFGMLQGLLKEVLCDREFPDGRLAVRQVGEGFHLARFVPERH